MNAGAPLGGSTSKVAAAFHHSAPRVSPSVNEAALDQSRTSGRDLANDLGIALGSRSCAVQVNHVQRREPQLLKTHRYLQRVVAVHCLLAVVAFPEPDAAALPDIEGRNDAHNQRLRKFRKITEPAADERSG